MRIGTLIGIILGFLATVGGFLDFILKFDKFFKIEATKIILTPDGITASLLFIIGLGGFIFSIFWELYQASKEIVHISGEIKKQNEAIKKEYDDISRRFMVYPEFRNIVDFHYAQLEDLYNIKKIFYENRDPRVKDLFEKYVKFWFNNFVYPDIKECINDLRDFTLKLESKKQDLFREFIQIFWNSVSQNGKIFATSIVNPSGFWHNAQAYLAEQKRLIEIKKCEIYRYFIFVKNHKDWLSKHIQGENILKMNIDNKIKVRVTLFKNEEDAGACYRDIGLVDDLMAVESKIDANNNITETICYITSESNSAKINEIQSIFRTLEEHQNTIKYENYKEFEKFIKIINDKINRL
jgi:hypothetical protein